MCFCIKALAQLFAFGFLPLKINNPKNKSNVLQVCQDKNHDENKSRRDGVGSKQKGEKPVGSGGILLTREYLSFFFYLNPLPEKLI